MRPTQGSYVTDVQAVPDKADAVAIPANINVIAQYPITTLKTSTQAPVDAAFTSFLLAPAGQAILAKYGFSAMTTTAPAEPDAVRHRRVGRERLPIRS